MKRLFLPMVISGAAVLVSAVPSCGAETTDLPMPPAAPSGEELELARARWQGLVTIDLDSARQSRVAQPVVDRLLATTHGRALIAELHELLVDTDDGTERSRIEVRFVDRVPHDSDDINGCFRPSDPAAERYEILVRTEYRDAAIEPTVFLFGEYPGNPDCSVVFFYEEAVSAMAQTLYHELLHVWFVNAFAHDGRRYPTGHGLVSRCEFEKEFFERLCAHAAELAQLEGRAPKPLLPYPLPRSRGLR